MLSRDSNPQPLDSKSNAQVKHIGKSNNIKVRHSMAWQVLLYCANDFGKGFYPM